MRYDRERLIEIVHEVVYGDRPDMYRVEKCYDQLEELLGSVRAEAVGHTWTEACSQYDKGMDPRLFEMPLLLKKAIADLNPEHD